MNHMKWCIDYLLKYNHLKEHPKIKENDLFRALQNITMPYDLSDDFYVHQDIVLKEIVSNKEKVDVSNFDEGISIYMGDITLFKADVIVNACNSKLLGCFVPWHHCIDNAIHSFAGLEVRRDLIKIMEEQGHDEPNGMCKVTKGYNLPAKFIFHTVGPVYNGLMQDDIDLQNCYLSCLKQADEMNLESIVFCSLSTGLFGFPIDRACEIAIKTVKKYLKEENKNIKKVIFDVFSKRDYDVYNKRIKEFN